MWYDCLRLFLFYSSEQFYVKARIRSEWGFDHDDDSHAMSHVMGTKVAAELKQSRSRICPTLKLQILFENLKQRLLQPYNHTVFLTIMSRITATTSRKFVLWNTGTFHPFWNTASTLAINFEPFRSLLEQRTLHSNNFRPLQKPWQERRSNIRRKTALSWKNPNLLTVFSLFIVSFFRQFWHFVYVLALPFTFRHRLLSFFHPWSYVSATQKNVLRWIFEIVDVFSECLDGQGTHSVHEGASGACRARTFWQSAGWCIDRPSGGVHWWEVRHLVVVPSLLSRHLTGQVIVPLRIALKAAAGRSLSCWLWNAPSRKETETDCLFCVLICCFYA